MSTNTFNTAVVIGVTLICGLAILFDKPEAHDVCLAGVSGLLGAIATSVANKTGLVGPQS